MIDHHSKLLQNGVRVMEPSGLNERGFGLGVSKAVYVTHDPTSKTQKVTIDRYLKQKRP